MYRAIKIICSFILLLSIFTFPLSNTTKANANDLQTSYLKVSFNDKILFHDKVEQGKYIQVLDAESEIVESVVLKGDLELELEQPAMPENTILSYWDITDSETKVIITPIFIETKKLKSRFSSEEGGLLLHNNSQIKELVKSFNENTLFADVAPEVKPAENYKFRGWFYKRDGENREKLNVTETTKAKDSVEYFALFYQDVNENEIDDKTEKITLKIVPNNSQKMKDMSLYVGQPFNIPKLEAKKDHIFIGWFLDKEFKTAYDSSKPITEDTTLYAKWEKAEKVIKESENNPITDKNVSDQVESMLNGRLDELEKAIAQSSAKQNSGNILPQPEQVQIPQDIQTITENQDGSNEVLKYTEPKYIFKNTNIGERYMVKFFDENYSFLFSISLPYGRTIHLLDQSENLIKEYSVRQDTTITLNVSDYVFNEDELLKFDSRTVKVNNSDITEVFPAMKPYEAQAAFAPKVADAEGGKNENLGILITSGILFILLIASIVFYLIKRNKKMNVDIKQI